LFPLLNSLCLTHGRSKECAVRGLALLAVAPEREVDVMEFQPIGIFSHGVYPVTRPGIGFGRADHLGSERILFDIAKARQPIAFVVDGKVSIPAVPECTDALMLPVVVTHVASAQLFHGLR
jgi:hypothetical protein